jgi:polar amino acid transport system substrate-binding protein
LSKIRQAGLIRVGYAVEAPYAFLGPQGEVTGQSPELAKLVCSLLGIPRIEWRLVEFGELIAELEQERIDVIAAGMFITPERAERVGFSEPIFHVRQSLLVAKNNPYRLHSYQDALALGQGRIAVLTGAVEEKLLQSMGATQAQLLLSPDAQTGRAAVESGLALGLALSSPTIQWMALREQLGKTEIAIPFEQPPKSRIGRLGHGAFAFRKNDVSLLDAWNGALQQAAASREYRSKLDEFGFTPQEASGLLSTREVLER